jgi:hypothetical protein
MFKFILAAVAVFLVFTNSNIANAKTCSQSTYQRIINQARGFDANYARCNRALNRRKVDANSMCRACGPFFRQASRLERTFRLNKSCFDARTRRSIAQLSAERANIDFVRRGCGY